MSHAAIRKLLQKHRRIPFCSCCCRRRRDKQINKNQHSNNGDYDGNVTTLHSGLVQFLANHHLSVLRLEKQLKIDGVVHGRVDGIFRSNIGDKNTIYIVDWKFLSNIPQILTFDYILQLNLYLYIMKRLPKFCHYNMRMYCLVFSTSTTEFKEYIVPAIPEDYIKSLLTIMFYV